MDLLSGHYITPPYDVPDGPRVKNPMAERPFSESVKRYQEAPYWLARE